MHDVLWIVLTAALLGPPAPVFSDPRAQAHFDRATELYGAGSYAEASEELRLTYELDPQPKLLYSRAQVERMVGNWDTAAELYQAYLDTNPPEEGTVHAVRHLAFCRAQTLRARGDCAGAVDAYDEFIAAYPDVAEVDDARTGREACEDALAAAEAAEAEDEIPFPTATAVREDPAEPTLPWYRSVPGGVLAGVGVVGAGVGGALVGLAYRDHRLAVDEPSHDASALRYDRARAREVAGAITLTFAATSLVLAGLAYGLAARRERRRFSVVPPGVFGRF
jgi:tetratricopeptide (TPR) repeat protein